MRLIGLSAAAISLLIASPSHGSAQVPLSLYQAMEIVTGTDMRERPRGFALCLEDVLVKLSGDPRLRTDPRLTEMKSHAADYVVSFNYMDPIAGTRPKDDQGTYDRSENLTITFDPAKIDALLASLGERPWRAPRPVLVPMLAVHGRKPPGYLLAADEILATEQRAAFERVADEAGIALRFPATAEFRTGSQCDSARTIIVAGTLAWSDASGWMGTWRTCWHGADHVWTIRGVGYDQAFENIVRGAVLLASGRGTPETLH